MSILVVMEQRGGVWNRMSWETVAAGQQMAKELGLPLEAAVVGKDTSALAAELAGKNVAAVLAVQHDLLEAYSADGYSAALGQLITSRKPYLTLFPHTYQVRDFGPKLATSLGRVLVSDAVSHRVENGRITLVRQLFQGKVNADVRFATEPPLLASLQAGAYRADLVEAGSAAVEAFTPSLDAATIRSKGQDLFRESARAVDLTAAEIIV
ncbi:MAG: electron transfer flavoprotein subunit alpha/FixB family protein, partial [Bryobacteraceae bacterium]